MRTALFLVMLFFSILVQAATCDPSDGGCAEHQAAPQQDQAKFFQMSPPGCYNYMMDAARVSLMRAGGITKEEVLRVFGTLNTKFYSADVWPIFLELVILTYGTDLGPKEWVEKVYKDCMERGGVPRI